MALCYKNYVEVNWYVKNISTILQIVFEKETITNHGLIKFNKNYIAYKIINKTYPFAN
jgi:hypothetical protein